MPTNLNSEYQNPLNKDFSDNRNVEIIQVDKWGNLIQPPTEKKPDERVYIDVEVKDRLLMELKRRLFPSDVEGIIYQAITGEMYWQDQLFQLMIDTWPRLQTNLDKLKRSVSSLDYIITPYKKENEKDATPSAIDKAETVREALFNMHGRIAFKEHDFKETLEDCIEAIPKGFIVAEVYWESRPNEGIVPQCTKVLPARYYRYPYVTNETDRLMLNPSGTLGGTQLMDFAPNKFLVCIKCAHTGPPVMTSMMRTLTVAWVAQRFGWEWFMTYTQLFGIPYRKATYQEGNVATYQKLVAMMQNSGAATWGVFPQDTAIEFLTAAGAGTAGPHERLIATADALCDIILLGQTLTTDVQDSGSRALGGVHKEVLDEITQAAALYACKIFNTQLIPGIVQYNYGNVEELPILEPVIKAPIELLQVAQAFQILFGKGPGQLGIPVKEKELYDRIDFTQPAEDDKDLFEPPEPMMMPFGGNLNEKGQPQPKGQGPNGSKAGTNQPKAQQNPSGAQGKASTTNNRGQSSWS